MWVSAADLNAYRAIIHTIGKDAGAAVAETVSGTHGSVTRIRETAIMALMDSVGIYGDLAQAAAAQVYDEVCAASGIETMPAELFDDLIDEGMCAEKVHYYSNRLMQGDDEGFAQDCADLAAYYMNRCAGQNTVRNCALNNVRFARVPTGPSTCDWCVMLASRGFVYHTAGSALASQHEGCDCCVIPGDEFTEVEGYDPALYYDMWKASGFMPSSGGRSATTNKFIKADLTKRTNDAIMRFETAKSMGEVASLVDEMNENLRGMSDRQVQGIQYAVERARRRLGGIR